MRESVVSGQQYFSHVESVRRLERGTTYEELGEDYFDQREVQRTKRRLVNRLEALGFTVRVEEPVTT